MLNHIVLQGRFTRDPELRHTVSGTPVCSFTLAVDRDAKQQDGTRLTDFIDCVAWSGTAEFINKYYRKGSAAVVDGRLELRGWVDKDGNNRRSAQVRVSNIYFAESKKDTGATSNTYGADADYPDTANFAELPDIDDGNLPF